MWFGLKKLNDDKIGMGLLIFILLLLIIRLLTIKKDQEKFSDDQDGKYELILEDLNKVKAPGIPTIVEIKSLPKALKIKWKAPSTPPDAPITSYTLMLRNEDDLEASVYLNFIGNPDCQVCDYLFPNLLANTTYSISVMANNKFTNSTPSSPRSGKTLDVLVTPSPEMTSDPNQRIEQKFWEDQYQELEKDKQKLGEDDFNKLIESAEGLLKPRKTFPDDYLEGLENQPNKLTEIAEKDLQLGSLQVNVRMNQEDTKKIEGFTIDTHGYSGQTF